MEHVKFTKRDVITPANAISVLGALLTIIGSFGLTHVSGLILIIIGRVADVIDGPVARRTRTSRIGAGLDAGLDKISALALLVGAYHYHRAPLWFLIFFLLYNVCITVYTYFTEEEGGIPKVSMAGKRAMFLHITALGFFIWSHFLHGISHIVMYDFAVVEAIASIVFVIQNITYSTQQLKKAHRALLGRKKQ